MERFEGPTAWLVTASGASLLLLVAALVAAVLMRPPARREISILIVLAIALPVLVQSLVVGEAVAGFRNAFAGVDPSQKASDLATAMSRSLNGAMVVGLALVLSSLIVGIAAALIVRHRGTAAVALGVMVGGVVALAGAGLGLYAWKVIELFGSVAAGDPSDKATMLFEGLKEARPLLVGSMIAAAALATLLMIAAAIERIRSKEDGGGPSVAIAGLLSATALVFVAQPYAREAWQEPLPFSATGELVYAVPGIETPALRGPDPIERAPTIALSSDRVSLEGMVVELETIAEKLREMVKVHEMLHPGDPPPGLVLLMCDRRTTASRAAALLREVKASGYREAMFVFQRTKTFDRPVLGKLTASGSSGARLGLTPSEGSTELVFGEEDFGAVAVRLVELRQKGAAVHLSP